MMLLAFLLIVVVHGSSEASGCAPLSFQQDSVVCVCNRTYCDTAPDISVSHDRVATIMTSTRSGQRLRVRRVSWSQKVKYTSDYIDTRFSHQSKHTGQEKTIQLIVDSTIYRQDVVGFGGAFTDAAGINLAKLPNKLQQSLIESYYHGTRGIGYTMARVPIGGCDFSTRPYTYDDVINDTDLINFNLTREDLEYKLPYLKLAQQAMSAAGSKKTLKVIGSPWSAPAWMKTNDRLNGRGTLQRRFYGPWAKYLAKFVSSYNKNSVPIWAITTQNEPINGLIPNFTFNCMSWTPQNQAVWVERHLSPALDTVAGQLNIRKPKIFVMDDDRFELPYWTDNFFKNKKAAHLVSGIALHWYADSFYPSVALDDSHKRFPKKMLLNTEACEGSMPWQIDKVSLGNWQRAEHYARDIINDLNHWVSGWIDWNIALDMNGGPNWVENFVDSPIIVDHELEQFYKQPMYYSMAHFAMFIPSGSAVVEMTEQQLRRAQDEGLMLTLVDTPAGNRVVVLLNLNEHSLKVTLVYSQNKTLTINIDAKSLTSAAWKI